jgi:hypothetical protein
MLATCEYIRGGEAEEAAKSDLPLGSAWSGSNFLGRWWMDRGPYAKMQAWKSKDERCGIVGGDSK